MDDIPEEICQEQLAWARRRLEALDIIEVKLKEMRELAVYAASRNLSKKEIDQVQEWIDILRNEVKAMDQATAWPEKNSLVH